MKRHEWVVSIGIVAFLLLALILYISVWMEVPGDSPYCTELVKTISIGIAVIGTIFSSLLSTFNTLATARKNSESLEFYRLDNAFKYMERFDTDSIKQARNLTRELKEARKEGGLSLEEICLRCDGDDGLKRSVITMFNYFEEIYLSITSNRASEEVLKNAMRFLYRDIYERFQGWTDAYFDEKQKAHLKALYDRWA